MVTNNQGATVENFLSHKKHRSYIFKKSLYSTLKIVCWYIIVLVLLSCISISPKLIKIITDSNYNINDASHELILVPLRETSKYITNILPLKDNMLIALGSIILTLFIHVRNENKDADKISGYHASTARANKAFSDIIIISLAAVMFINFCSTIFDKLDHMESSIDKPEPWLLVFFMFFTLTIRSLEEDNLFFIKEQIIQTEDRILTINVHSREIIEPNKKNDRLHTYKHLNPFQYIKLKTFGYLKYYNTYILLRLLILFLFLLCIAYYTVFIGEYFSFLPNYFNFTLDYPSQVFYNIHVSVSKNFFLACIISIRILISFLILNIIHKLSYNQLNLHSRGGCEGLLLRSIFLIALNFGKFISLIFFIQPFLPSTSLPLYIPESILNFISLYILLIPLYILIIPLISLTVIYFITIYKLHTYYKKKLNRSLGLPVNQSLKETNTSAELYYLNSKLESLQSLQKYMIEDQQNSYIEQNRSGIDSENIKISYE